MPDFVALALIMLWPIIPIWWIPVHGAKWLVRRLGFSAYLIVLVLWFPIALLVYACKDFVFSFRINIPSVMSIAGMFLFLFGSFVQLWVVRLLTIRGITGTMEIQDEAQKGPITRGPFAVVRHPTYSSHALMFFGIFLWTGIVVAGLVALADLTIISAVVIPLEEKELLIRFGGSYKSYMERVPRLIPGIKRRTRQEEP
ncbi:MAG: hypothetical protein A4E62_01366 [Syntrophorhabdus sp. PtaU1.Bin002]|nr:MAG: hypothetical protein A4E62_01366 [Syntrophorhabdus sp. PtaU1.Bin002]